MAFTYAKQLLYQLSHIPSLLQVFNRSNLVSKGDIFGCSTKEKMLLWVTMDVEVGVDGGCGGGGWMEGELLINTADKYSCFPWEGGLEISDLPSQATHGPHLGWHQHTSMSLHIVPILTTTSSGTGTASDSSLLRQGPQHRSGF